jgi:hypothetical protein
LRAFFSGQLWQQYFSDLQQQIFWSALAAISPSLWKIWQQYFGEIWQQYVCELWQQYFWGAVATIFLVGSGSSYGCDLCKKFLDDIGTLSEAVSIPNPQKCRKYSKLASEDTMGEKD